MSERIERKEGSVQEDGTESSVQEDGTERRLCPRGWNGKEVMS